MREEAEVFLQLQLPLFETLHSILDFKAGLGRSSAALVRHLRRKALDEW